MGTPELDPCPRVTSCGKQVLLDGQHFADAVSEVAAAGLADALNYVGLGFTQIPPEANVRILRALEVE